MKKGKVIRRGQLLLAVMVVALGAAVWLNMKYSSTKANSNTKYLGQADFVDNAQGGEAVLTGAQEDYFSKTKSELQAARTKTKEELTESVKTAGDNSEAAKSAVDKLSVIASRESAEANIQSLLKAKGFSDSMAIIGDNDVNVVVRAESLDSGQTVQIQDIAAAQSGYTLDKIKIVTVK